MFENPNAVNVDWINPSRSYIQFTTRFSSLKIKLQYKFIPSNSHDSSQNSPDSEDSSKGTSQKNYKKQDSERFTRFSKIHFVKSIIIKSILNTWSFWFNLVKSLYNIYDIVCWIKNIVFTMKRKSFLRHRKQTCWSFFIFNFGPESKMTYPFWQTNYYFLFFGQTFFSSTVHYLCIQSVLGSFLFYFINNIINC